MYRDKLIGTFPGEIVFPLWYILAFANHITQYTFAFHVHMVTICRYRLIGTNSRLILARYGLIGTWYIFTWMFRFRLYLALQFGTFSHSLDLQCFPLVLSVPWLCLYNSIALAHCQYFFEKNKNWFYTYI